MNVNNMNRDASKKGTKIKRVNELNDQEVERLYNALEAHDEIQMTMDTDIERLKEEINERIYQLRMEIENDRNNIDFFNNNIIIKKEEIDRLIRKLDFLD